MSKKLFIAKNIIFLINIFLFIACTIYGLPQIEGIHVVLAYFIVVIAVTTTAFNTLKDLKHINYNDKYNLIFIVSNLIIMFIMLRGIFDNSIVTNVYHQLDEVNGSYYRMKFVANNLFYFNLIYISLICYQLTINKGHKN
ncbi:MAG: hypothetical protein PHI05_01230 [Bacilli bacterium]|nr:hypothetical protein [Bacilli bacterium]MDD4547350.1 hypothetical protein [Bacilli bacterium]